jgi:hypothetical protein
MEDCQSRQAEALSWAIPSSWLEKNNKTISNTTTSSESCESNYKINNTI